MQGFFILADIDDPVLIGVRFGKAGLYGILQSVLRRLVDDVEGRQRLLHSRHRSACGAGGGKAERKGGLALAGIALQNGQLSEGDIRIPQPVHLPQLHLRHSEDFGFVVYHNVFPFFSVVFFFGRHSHIHPAFHKNLFCGARLCSARESSPSFPALRSFSCTPDSVPTLLLTVYRIGVCALLAVSSFESAWSAPFSYGTIPRIAVPAKSAAAYPVGRIFGCV